ncbi:MAG: ParB/RepB/Spo0J family partition protein [Synechocystis sp.]|nr:ParB/RepB/Spo0J family partition protein [Synechocystis sp.]
MTNSKKNEPYTSELKGVDALLGGKDKEIDNQPAANPFSQIALDKLQPSAFQPRCYFDNQQHQQLVDSIRQHGILEPLLVRPIGDERYEIVAGERRYRAAKEINLAQVPVIVKTLDDKEATQIALIENLQRVNLNPIEETEGILRLLGITLDIDEQQVKSLLHRMRDEERQKVPHNVMGNSEAAQIIEVFKAVGTSTWQSFVNNRLPLLNLSADILDALRQGKIEYTKAKEIAKLKDETQRAALLQEAIAEGLSLSQIKERLAGLKPQPDVAMPKAKIQQLSKRLNQQKLWETDKGKWKKIEGWLNKIETLLADNEDEKVEETTDSATSSDPNSEPLTEDSAGT